MRRRLLRAFDVSDRAMASCNRTEVVMSHAEIFAQWENRARYYRNVATLLHFRAHFTDHCSKQSYFKLSMKRQAEFVQCDFIAKRIAQTRVATELGFSERPPGSVQCFSEQADLGASSCERS